MIELVTSLLPPKGLFHSPSDKSSNPLMAAANKRVWLAFGVFNNKPSEIRAFSPHGFSSAHAR